MAEGYSDIAHGTYSIWKANTLGRAFDLDGSFGCQCWDYASLFWRNVGFPAGYPLTGVNGYAYECWTVSRYANADSQFTLINNKQSIQTGDIIVLNAGSLNPAGHIAFADEDYNGTDYIYAIGQNQGGTPDPSGGTPVTRNQIGLDQFLGAFRYKAWHTTPPTPSLQGVTKKRFPWVLYANKLRSKY